MKTNLKKPIIFCLFIILAGSQLFAQDDRAIADSIYYDGKDYYRIGNYHSSIAELTKALKLYKKLYGENHERVMKAHYNLGKAKSKAVILRPALEHEQKALEIGIKLFGYESEDVGYILQNIGNIYDQMYEMDEAKNYYKKSIKVFEAVHGVPSLEVGGARMNLGNILSDNAQYYEAEQLYFEALENFKRAARPNSKAFNKIYINLSDLYRQLGNYDKAIEYGKEALKIKLLNYDELHPSVPKYYGNIGRSLQRKGDYKAALPYFQKAVELSVKSAGYDDRGSSGALADLGGCYIDLKQVEKGLNLFLKAEASMEKEVPETNIYLNNIRSNIANIYERELKQYDKALAIYESSLKKHQKGTFIRKPFVARSKRHIAEIHLNKNDPGLALKIIQEGMQALAPDFKPERNDVYANPKLTQTESYIELIKTFDTKSDILYSRYQQHSNIEDLKQALICSELAIKTIEKQRRSFMAESARRFVTSNTNEIFENSIVLAYELYEKTQDIAFLEKAFLLSEKNKSYILWRSVNERHAFQAAGIPETLKDSINILHQQILYSEKQLTKSDPTLSDSISKKIFDLKLSYENLIKILEQDHPDYYELKYNQNLLSSVEVQNRLPDAQSAMVSYFYTSKNLYSFLITKDQFVAKKTALQIPVPDLLNRVRVNNLENLFDPPSQKLYIENLVKLYELLIHPLENHLQSSSQIVFIPYAALQQLPFEMLTSSSKQFNFKDLNYLLKSFDIQYAWSATLWGKRPNQTVKSNLDFLGFAPGFKAVEGDGSSSMLASRAQLTPLPYSINEIQFASAFFEGQAFVDDAATKSNFLKLAGKSRVIHLATHGILDDQHPEESAIVFSNNSADSSFTLNIAEIYKLHIPAELAIMSACNSGFGRLEKGEGIMSLGRAFYYAGCKSIITSLWSANDESTSYIMKQFYQFTDNGTSKDQALRQAKLDYLNQSDPLTAHPYFWANLVAVGDMTPLKSSSNISMNTFVVIITVLIGLIWIIYKKRN